MTDRILSAIIQTDGTGNCGGKGETCEPCRTRTCDPLKITRHYDTKPQPSLARALCDVSLCDPYFIRTIFFISKKFAAVRM